MGTRRTTTVTTTPRIVFVLLFAYALFILLRADQTYSLLVPQRTPAQDYDLHRPRRKSH